jgi:hypothetical protein
VKKLDFIYFDAGGGHRSAAMALQQVIAQQGRPWEIRMVNLQEQLDTWISFGGSPASVCRIVTTCC